MKKIEMIKSHQEFSDIIKHSYYKKDQNLSIYIRKTQYNYSHYGIAVKKKIGNAVKRNLCKRRMRSIIDKYKNKLRTDSDYIIIMKENCSQISFQELENSFQNLTSILERVNYEKKK